jgi:hypothetical protein
MSQTSTALGFVMVVGLWAGAHVKIAAAESECQLGRTTAAISRSEQGRNNHIPPEADSSRHVLTTTETAAPSAVIKHQNLLASSWGQNAKRRVGIMNRWGPRYRDIRRQVY